MGDNNIKVRLPIYLSSHCLLIPNQQYAHCDKVGGSHVDTGGAALFRAAGHPHNLSKDTDRTRVIHP